MLALDEGEVLRGSQCETRSQQPLRRRVAGEVQEQRGAFERAALFETLAKEFRAVVGHTDAGEHDGEVVAGATVRSLAQAGVAGDLDGDAGFDEVARTGARDRIDGQALDAVRLPCGDGRAAIDHLPDAVEHAAEDRWRNTES